MDSEKMFDKLVEKLGREGIGRIAVGRICPSSFDLSTAEECAPNLQNCNDCWAGAMGLAVIDSRRDYEEIFDVLIEKLGNKELSRIIIDQGCPSSFGLSNAKHCGIYPRDCPDCWADALGMEE